MIRATLTGAEHLPKSVQAGRLLAAVQQVGRMIGIKGRIKVDISNRPCNSVGRCYVHEDGHFMIRLYAKPLHTCHRRSIRYGYAITVAHELFHASQIQRGMPTRVFDSKVAEDEALAIESVYGPIVDKVLRG